MKEKLKKLSKKWWFWVIIAFLIIGSIGMESDNNTQSKKYILTGESVGKYGKEVILNKNTDLPTTKYLYKISSGNYKVTTTYEKIAVFYIVKDEINTTGNAEYPEELNYVGEAYTLTNGNDVLNEQINKSVEITILDDESIEIVGTETLIFEKE